jgi:hypothetical protein
MVPQGGDWDHLELLYLQFLILPWHAQKKLTNCHFCVYFIFAYITCASSFNVYQSQWVFMHHGNHFGYQMLECLECFASLDYVQKTDEDCFFTLGLLLIMANYVFIFSLCI